MIFGIEVQRTKNIWRTSKVEFAVWLVTFVACLFWKLDWGILLGTGINMILLLAAVSRPKMGMQTKHVRVFYSYFQTKNHQTNNFAISQLLCPDGSSEKMVWVTLDQGLLFPSAARLKTRLEERTDEQRGTLILDCSRMTWLDYSATEGLKVGS